MKRLLLICGIAALLVVSSAWAAKPAPQQGTIATSCVSPCVMQPREANGLYLVNVTGSGYNSKTTYGLCIDAPAISYCSGIAQPVGSDGVLHSGFSTGTPGNYCVHFVNGRTLAAVSPTVCFAVVLE